MENILIPQNRHIKIFQIKRITFTNDIIYENPDLFPIETFL